jgi:hypothetical protein
VEKKLNASLAEIQAAHPQATVEVWSQDEARLGLFTVLRRVWAPRGKRPLAVVQPRRIWAYVRAFVHPASRRSHLWVWPSVNIAMMTAMLASFARLAGAGASKRLVLVLDQAAGAGVGSSRLAYQCEIGHSRRHPYRTLAVAYTGVAADRASLAVCTRSGGQ